MPPTRTVLAAWATIGTTIMLAIVVAIILDGRRVHEPHPRVGATFVFLIGTVVSFAFGAKAYAYAKRTGSSPRAASAALYATSILLLGPTSVAGLLILFVSTFAHGRPLRIAGLATVARTRRGRARRRSRRCEGIARCAQRHDGVSALRRASDASMHSVNERRTALGPITVVEPVRERRCSVASDDTPERRPARQRGRHAGAARCRREHDDRARAHDLVRARTSAGNADRALHVAVWSKRLATARLLLERGADVHAEDCAGYTAIDHTQDYDLVELLLAHGAAPDGGPRIAWPIDRYEGRPLLERLASFGKVPVVRLLLDAGADLAKHPRALSIACTRGHEDLISLLLERGADPTSALHDVAATNEKYLRILLERGANPNVLDASGQTPLAVVVPLGLDRAARLLIDRGADVHVRSASGESLYEVARRAYDAGVNDARVIMQLLVGLGVGPAPVAKAPEPVVPSGPVVGARVTHKKFGPGAITHVDADKLEVTFDSGEKKTLLAKFVELA